MLGSLSTGAPRAIIAASNFMTWASSAIVVGITAYFLDNYPHDQHLIFEIVISALTLGMWLPSFVLPFLGRSSPYKPFFLPLNLIFSYLWLTSFIFAAQDYNESDCFANAPTGGSCSLKLTSEAFIFLAFFFTLLSTVLDVMGWRRAAAAAAGDGQTGKDARGSGEGVA